MRSGRWLWHSWLPRAVLINACVPTLSALLSRWNISSYNDLLGGGHGRPGAGLGRWPNMVWAAVADRGMRMTTVRNGHAPTRRVTACCALLQCQPLVLLHQPSPSALSMIRLLAPAARGALRFCRLAAHRQPLPSTLSHAAAAAAPQSSLVGRGLRAMAAASPQSSLQGRVVRGIVFDMVSLGQGFLLGAVRWLSENAVPWRPFSPISFVPCRMVRLDTCLVLAGSVCRAASTCLFLCTEREVQPLK